MMNDKKGMAVIIVLALALGIYFRLSGIAQNDFFLYDEGLYMTMHRGFDEIVTSMRFSGAFEVLEVLKHNLYLSLSGGKPLWVFLVHLRSFFGGFEAFYFARILAAVFGLGTLAMTYFFARRYFKSESIAWLSLLILALLPGHVFYSRLALQETLSGLCLLSGLYLYLFSSTYFRRTVLSGLLFALTYFSNYRMIIVPIHVLLAEWLTAAGEGRRFDARRYVWSMASFIVFFMAIALLHDADHMKTNLMWMFFQADLAQGHIRPLNFLTYPYTIWRLEGVIFGLFLFTGVSFLWRRQWTSSLPLFLVLFQMTVFSLAHDQGSRYLCVVMPFMAMAAACVIERIFSVGAGRPWARALATLGVLAMFVDFGMRSYAVSQFTSDYRTSMEDLLRTDRNVKVLSTQSMVQNLYSPRERNVQELPHGIEAVRTYEQYGYRYLILCPQAYAGYARNKVRFFPKLEEPLDFLVRDVRPVKEYDHFSQPMLERFVFEHNADLIDSVAFLELSKQFGFNKLRVYGITDYVEAFDRR